MMAVSGAQRFPVAFAKVRHSVAAVGPEDARGARLLVVIDGHNDEETSGSQVVPGTHEELALVADPLDQAVDPAPQPMVAAGDIQPLRTLGAAQHRDPVACEAGSDKFLEGCMRLVGPVEER